jgi:hypothetical protein
MATWRRETTTTGTRWTFEKAGDWFVRRER